MQMQPLHCEEIHGWHMLQGKFPAHENQKTRRENMR